MIRCISASERVPLELTVIDCSRPVSRSRAETLFSVEVTAVNTIRQRGKVKRFRGRPGKRPDYKKAIVSLAEGHMIDVTTGV